MWDAETAEMLRIRAHIKARQPQIRPTWRAQGACITQQCSCLQARSNVGKRLEFIRRELERLQGQAASLAEKHGRKQQQVITADN